MLIAFLPLIIWPGIFIALTHLYLRLAFLWGRRRPIHYGRRLDKACSDSRPTPKNNRKPDWVVRAVIRLKAYQPKAGCMTLAMTFNRFYSVSQNMTVSKSYVAYTVRRHRSEILHLRRRIRRKKPLTMPRNAVWGIDLTGKSDVSGKMHSILGILDHGTRYPLLLEVISGKSSWSLLGHLFLAIDRFGKPQAIRTDNERCFTSWIFTAGLRCLGIRHQRIDLHCPWQNGRVERFFGTLKQALNQWSIASGKELQDALALFRDWHATVKPHANLNGATPSEAWHGINPCHKRPQKIEWFSAWEGLLTGYRIGWK